MTILVTGGAGFIGANFVIDWLQNTNETIVNLDNLTYAGNAGNLACLKGNQHHIFVKGDMADRRLVDSLLRIHKPRAVINFAAESHVDRPICSPAVFIQTNIIGTFRLLEAVQAYWDKLSEQKMVAFRFLQISTDKVYGSLTPHAPAFSETSRYEPNSPYSASKAASDHLVRAYHHTYGLPILTTNCSNNYGPFQFPEKLIPLIIHNALAHKSLPIYRDGLQVRDWLYVSDHCNAIRTVLAAGMPGEVYNVGGLNEKTNIEIAYTICDALDQEIPPLKTDAGFSSYRALITHVADQPGHDQRYAIDATKIKQELNWHPSETFETGIHKTVQWYLSHQNWVKNITSGDYRQWIEKQYA